MTDVPQEDKKESKFIERAFDKFMDRLPTLDDHKSRLLFVSMLCGMAFTTLTVVQKEQFGWIVFLTFVIGIFAGLGVELLRQRQVKKEDKNPETKNIPAQ